MTWGSFFSRTAGVLLVLPLTLRRLELGEIVVWYLFTTIFSLQWILDLGFGSTASRAVSYAAAGALKIGEPLGRSAAAAEPFAPNSLLLARIVHTLRWTYLALGAVAVVLLATFGTWALIEPVHALPDPREAWTCWILILACYPIGMWGNQYWVYLEGINQVALTRRWDMFTGFATSASMAIALLAGWGLLGLVIAYHAWALLRVVIFRQLSVSHRSLIALTPQRSGIDREIFAHLWAGAWRSGIGGLMSYGLNGAASFMVAHAGNASAAASYLVSYRLLEAVLQFSQAPFYGKLPALVRLRATGDLPALISLARRGMLMGYWCFIAGFIGLGVSADLILRLIGSRATFAEPRLWAVMGLAMLSHFFGAMHIQLYSTTDRIIWHVANTVAGCIFVVVCWGLLGRIGVYAVSVGWLCGYAGFYGWYSASHSYRSIRVGAWQFDRGLAVPPALIMVAYALIAFLSPSGTG